MGNHDSYSDYEIAKRMRPTARSGAQSSMGLEWDRDRRRLLDECRREPRTRREGRTVRSGVRAGNVRT